jgi:hypothetical protein
MTAPADMDEDSGREKQRTNASPMVQVFCHAGRRSICTGNSFHETACPHPASPGHDKIGMSNPKKNKVTACKTPKNQP